VNSEAVYVIFTSSSNFSRTFSVMSIFSIQDFSMAHPKFRRFLRFLRQELAIPKADLRLALRHPEHNPDALPMILWQYGLVSLSQLNQIFDWLEPD
jgi:hypothetical protein